MLIEQWVLGRNQEKAWSVDASTFTPWMSSVAVENLTSCDLGLLQVHRPSVTNQYGLCSQPSEQIWGRHVA